MTDLTKMGPMEAIEWYDGSKFDFWDVKTLVERGIVDTKMITKILRSDLDIDQLVAVPDLEPTDENLELLVKVGSEIMLNDRENAQDWAKLIDDFDLDEDVVVFREAGRSPSFARKVLDLFARQDRYMSSLADYDMTRSYAEIASRVESGLTMEALRRWEGLGVDLEAALKYEADGLTSWAAELLRAKYGIERLDWLRYKDLPVGWLGRGSGTVIERPMPEGWATIDDLLDLYQRGYTKGMPWAAKMPSDRYYATMSFSLDQARLLANAGLTTEDMARMWDGGSTSGRRAVDNAPPQLLPYNTGNKQDLDHETIVDLIAVRAAGVRASHLQDYRWSGCHSLKDILKAVAAGINPARVKLLRAKYGYQKRWATDPKRIMDLDGLLRVHARYEDDLKVEAEAKAKVDAMKDAEIGSHPKGGFFAKLGKKVAQGDTPELAALNLLKKLEAVEDSMPAE